MYVDLYIYGHGCDDSPKNWFTQKIEQARWFNWKLNLCSETYVSISNMFLKTNEVISWGERENNHECEWPSTNYLHPLTNVVMYGVVMV